MMPTVAGLRLSQIEVARYFLHWTCRRMLTTTTVIQFAHLAFQEHTECREHHANSELGRVFGHPRERMVGKGPDHQHQWASCLCPHAGGL